MEADKASVILQNLINLADHYSKKFIKEKNGGA